MSDGNIPNALTCLFSTIFLPCRTQSTASRIMSARAVVPQNSALTPHTCCCCWRHKAMYRTQRT